MTDRSVRHATFAIEKRYAASPAEVFDAFAVPERKDRWFVKAEGWPIAESTHDFRVGGTEHGRFSPDGTMLIYNDTIYQDIEPGQRIVFAYSMRIGEKRISSSLATVEFIPDGEGTHLIYTEQGAFLDGEDQAEDRKRGCAGLLDALSKEIDRAKAA